MKQLSIILSSLILTSCGSVETADPYNDDQFDEPPPIVKIFVDSTGLNCSLDNPCNTVVNLVPANSGPNIEVMEIGAQTSAAIYPVQLANSGTYMLSVSGVPTGYHANYPNGANLSTDDDNLALQVTFESGVVYTQ